MLAASPMQSAAQRPERRNSPQIVLGSKPPAGAGGVPLLRGLFGYKLLVVGGREQAGELVRSAQRDLQHPSGVRILVDLLRRSCQFFIHRRHGSRGGWKKGPPPPHPPHPRESV